MLAIAVAATLPGWTLVWSDEFDMPGLPNPSKWGYDVGYIANEEKQWYIKARKENSRVEGGRLIIEARKDNHEGHPFSSARLTTATTQTWTYGRFEIRAKVPGGRGTWPAIWTLGSSINTAGWPKCGEIDIMEFVGYDPEKVHFNVHTKSYNHIIGTNKGTNVDAPKLTDAYHVYAIEWDAESIKWFFDDKKVFEFKNEHKNEDVWPFDKPQYLILNLAIGGTWGGQKGIDEAIFPARFEVDYVRVYKKK
jgi:beta-glucanase (GH16 family)